MSFNPDLPRSEDNHPDERYYDHDYVGKAKRGKPNMKRDFTGALYRFGRKVVAGQESSPRAPFVPRKSDNFRLRLLIEYAHRRLEEASIDLAGGMKDNNAGGWFFDMMSHSNFGVALDVMQEFIREKLSDPKYTLPADIMQNVDIKRLCKIAKENGSGELGRIALYASLETPIEIPLDVGTLVIEIEGDEVMLRFSKKQ
ncbi:MAG: hypothetical protein UT33_C0018G0024 [Candidatus Peregrinibacteria bacterium GW2011_GWC2_39_14]|nr:MAG: hypothetical protein US92_C0003G0005 [Candidatus Peregrinibacteria bacterium GW2011_GWA2_38_36]KKR04672.1 MAG: hypothetical protein UT33_C0018G0024 [Candidatus Peregrinibacteria bacterium GW2011_GWC2_39_14]